MFKQEGDKISQICIIENDMPEAIERPQIQSITQASQLTQTSVVSQNSILESQTPISQSSIEKKVKNMIFFIFI